MIKDTTHTTEDRIYGMKKGWEKIERIARHKNVDIGKVKDNILASRNDGETQKKYDASEIIELVGDPSIIQQLLSICPDFFSKEYLIIQSEEGEKLTPYSHLVNFKIIKNASKGKYT